MQQSTIITTIRNDNNFALFGFNNKLQQIQQSIINITVGFNLYNGALICFQCDVSITNTVTVFIANGQFLSGLVFNSVQIIQLQNTSIQYRFVSEYSAGLIYNVAQQISQFDLSAVNILGYNTINTNQAHFILVLQQYQNINISQVKICQETAMFANESQFISFSASVYDLCKSICAPNTYYVYGICANQLINSDFQVNNETFVCINNAIFDSQQCICKEDHILNGSVCVNISQSLTNIYKHIQSLSNVEADMNTAFQLINNLNQSVETELTQLQQNMDAMFNQVELHMYNNISTVNYKLDNNSNELDQRIFNNVSKLQQELVNSSISLQQQINLSTQSLSNAITTANNYLNTSTTTLNKSISELNQSLIQNINQINNNIQNVQIILQSNIVSNFTTLEQRLASNITQKDLQIQQLTDSLAFVTSIVMNTIEQELWFECQQQLYTFKVFDLTSSTNTIQSSNYVSGFAFDTLVIQNAFLDVQSISSSFTLFKTQSSFLNIKVQLNNISFGTGAMLSPSSSVHINQLAMVSKTGTQITINAGVVLSILQQTATVTNITNLLLNINMTPTSAGIISLINTVNGQLIVKGYQILGSYSSTNTISLCTHLVQQQSQVFLNCVNIKPQMFTCGNQSSFLLSKVNICVIDISRVSIQIGDITNLNEISRISTTLTNYFQYGGLISESNSSTITVNDISTMHFENHILFQSYSGQLIGLTNNSKISLQIICAYQYLNSTTNSQINMFGILGYLNGYIIIDQFSAQMILNAGVFNNVGVIGLINGTAANFINVIVEMTIKGNQGTYAAAICGMMLCQSQQVVNATIQNSHIESKQISSLVSASTNNITLLQVRGISNYVYVNCNITSGELAAFSGGLIGDILNQSFLQQCYVFNLTAVAESSNSWAIAAGLIVDTHNIQAFIQQSIVDSSYFYVSGTVKNLVSAGGIFGYMYDSLVSVQQTQVTNSNISGQSVSLATFIGGFVSYFRNQNISISESSVMNIQLTAQCSKKIYVGLIVSANVAVVYTATHVKTEGNNFINSVSIANCPNAVYQTPSGC
ncbi:Hypothetical_protein [Hexamita inflata]|nr:Hypothetical protein HINF_LOCUS39951 [Hexamita inflata]